MMKRISLVLALLLIIEPLILNAAEAGRVAVALYPEKKDDFLNKVISDLGGILSSNNCCKIVDQKLVEDVAAYHNQMITSKEFKDKASLDLDIAKDAYFNFKYKDAKKFADKVISELRKVGYQSAGGKLLDAMILRMLVAKALNEEDIVSSLSAEIVKIDPNINLEEGELPPSLAKKVEEARAKLFEAGFGSLKVASNPKSVELFVNGVSHGMTPASFKKLPVGEYLITLKASHYENFNQVVLMKDKKTISVNGKLKWAENAIEAVELNKVAKSSRLAGLLQADKLVLLSTNPSQNLITAQVIDRRFSVAEKPMSARINGSSRDYNSNLMKFADKISEQARHDIENGTLKVAEISPDTPATFFDSLKKPIYRRPLFWAGVGVLLGALGGGLVIAFSGGGSSAGDLKVNLGASSGR